MTPQSAFMVVAPVSKGKLDDLRGLLSSMNRAPAMADANNSVIKFGQFDRLHTARLVIIEANTIEEIRAFDVNPRPWKPVLAFMGDIDGDVDSFLQELVRDAGAGLSLIFSHCDGFAGADHDFCNWLKDHNVKAAVNYVNFVGRTVVQIRQEQSLHECLAAYLQDIAGDVEDMDTRQLRQRLLTHVEWQKHEGKLELTPAQPTPLVWRLRNLAHLIGVPLVLVWLSPVFFRTSPSLLFRLRQLEKSEPELLVRPDRASIERLTVQEDHDVTNQYNVFGDLKPGFFRRWAFLFTLVLVEYFARHVYNRGFLSRVRTIPFARWVVMDEKHRVFFASTYDGSHESYMDDFINKVGWGLNLIFSHGVGYPKTSWLIKEGASRELQFKYTQRRHQLGSEVWYKAYPGLTAVDLHRNSRIRDGLDARPISLEAMREWLALI